LELSVSYFLIASNGLQSYVLDKLINDSEGIELVFLANADDIAVAVSSDSRNGKGLLVIRKFVELVDRWLEENGFQMSTTKTKILHCCRKHPCQDPDIRLRGIAIQVINNAKFLDVTFDSKLRCGVQVKENKQRAHNALYIKWESNQDIILKIHNTLILSRIEYGSELYGTASESILKALNPVQYSGIREALGAFCTSCRESLLAERAQYPI
jgi:hypothetical protein